MRTSPLGPSLSPDVFLRRVLMVLAGLAVLLLPGRAGLALINPNFTPADMVQSAEPIVVMEVSAPEDGRMTASMLRTLKGDALAERTVELDATKGDLRPHEAEAAFAGGDHAPAMFFAHEESGWGQPDGVLLIDTTWFSVFFADDGDWHLDSDIQDVEAVWAGSARQLERAVQYVLEERTAEFPVAAEMRWEKIEPLGRLDGQARGMLRADLGNPLGRVAMVLSTGGDRLYQVRGGGEAPVDITDRAKLRTASRHAVVGDFTGSGRLDIASWDGDEVLLSVQGEDGTFGIRPIGVQLADCRSLAAVDVGDDSRSGLLAGRADGPPLLIVPEDDGFAVRPLPASEADLGAGGVCLAADLDGNGRWDVVRAFARGLVLYKGGPEPGTFDDEPVVVPMPLVENPAAVLAADYDLDGRLDLLIAGEDGIALLRQEDELSWVDATQITGELWRHANVAGEPIVAVSPADINADGRPGVAFMLPGANPMVFFNRGFAVFGLSLDLLLADSDLEEAANLTRGQTAGLMADLTGNGAQDLLTVDPEQRIWLVRGRMVEEPGLWLTLSVPEGAVGPRTVSVSVGDRVQGMHVLRPGVPAVIGCRRRGPVDLTWTEPDGSKKSQRVVVVRPTTAALKP